MSVEKIFNDERRQPPGVAQKMALLLKEIPGINNVSASPLVMDNIPMNTGFICVKAATSSETRNGRQVVEWEFMFKFADNLSGDARKSQRLIGNLLEQDKETSIIGKLKTTRSKSRGGEENPNAIGYEARVFRVEVEYGQGTTDKPYAIVHGTIFAQV